MKSITSFIVYCCLSARSSSSRFLESKPPVYKVAPISIAPSVSQLNGTAHKDNFEEEVIDQADPEFDMVSGGDDCINLTDAQIPYEESFQHGAMGKAIWTEEQKKKAQGAEQQIMANLKMLFDFADSNGDGCINRTEFQAAAEMEGPPPGYQRRKTWMVGAANFSEELKEEDRFEFKAMDRNADGKVSQSEAYHYAGENMPQADIDEQVLKDIFEETDINGDKFITFEEFVNAGSEYEGDGKEMQLAEPMWPTSLISTYKKQVLSGAIKTRGLHLERHRIRKHKIH